MLYYTFEIKAKSTNLYNIFATNPYLQAFFGFLAKTKSSSKSTGPYLLANLNEAFYTKLPHRNICLI